MGFDNHLVWHEEEKIMDDPYLIVDRKLHDRVSILKKYSLVCSAFLVSIDIEGMVDNFCIHLENFVVEDEVDLY